MHSYRKSSIYFEIPFSSHSPKYASNFTYCTGSNSSRPLHPNPHMLLQFFFIHLCQSSQLSFSADSSKIPNVISRTETMLMLTVQLTTVDQSYGLKINLKCYILIITYFYCHCLFLHLMKRKTVWVPFTVLKISKNLLRKNPIWGKLLRRLHSHINCLRMNGKNSRRKCYEIWILWSQISPLNCVVRWSENI